MKKYAFSLSADYSYADAISKHGFLLRCMPGTFPFQRTYAHSLTVKPYTALTHTKDCYGNEMCTGTIDKSHKSFSFQSSGFVLASKYLIHDPLDRLYLYPTAATKSTPGMQSTISQAPLPEDEWARAKALLSLTHRLMGKAPDLEHSTAAEAFAAGKGDARDLTHVFMALCRVAGLAARCAIGLTVGISQPHVWAEVYCGGLWRALDPFCGKCVEEGYLKIAHGPDYNSCAMLRSCYRDSSTDFTKDIQVEVTEHVILTRDTVPHA